MADQYKVVTGKVRASYVNIFTPRAVNPGDDPKYGMALIIPKSDKATIDALRVAEAAAYELGVTTKWNGRRPVTQSIIHDGDTEADLEKNPEYSGSWYMNVSSPRKPGVVDQSVQPILDPEELYSGCWVRVSVRAFPYAGKRNGVSFGLQNVQKLADGERLGGAGSSPEDDFSAEYADLM